MSAGVWVAVAGLGGLGSLARFIVSSRINRRSSTRFPVGTLAVNLSGALLLGLLDGLALGGDALILAGTATLGSYTTFSTWMLENHELGQEGERRSAAANVVVSLVAGFGAAALGHAIGAACR